MRVRPNSVLWSIIALSAVMLVAMASPATPVTWHLQADIVESCCCAPICPCMVGSAPTRGHCHGNRLVEIRQGRYGDVEFEGVRLVVTFNIGEWTKLYIDENATDAQLAAIADLLEVQGGFLYGDVLEVARVPLTVKRSGDRVEFRVPASAVEIELMRGPNGEPISVNNLDFEGYTQYKSVKLVHEAEDPEQSFELSGTNGFTAQYAASSETVER
jgi:hypothetical protein